ncbi:energy transducer TonB [Robiginitomaculum antarcticum]|uniref:energy transducer TonB n=1 Tax=Robiginitomaculum antarcticum TaxID=437507 RepID=UPI00035CCC58|nr:energy transducer TonB [Robiginitomaculum antarcticum]
MNITRWIIGIPIAAVLTYLLFVLMMVLIDGEWEAQEKSDIAKFEIDPKVEDLKVIKRETVIDEVRRVTTPPPPPQIERQQAVQPNEPIATLEGAIPEFDAPKIDRQSFKIAVSDRDAQPLVRIPPSMPPRAEKSGHCRMRFDVSPQGSPYNVVATYCTQSLFERNSVKAVEKFKYNPKMQDGQAISRRGVETKITFQLADERGKIIPE